MNTATLPPHKIAAETARRGPRARARNALRAAAATVPLLLAAGAPAGASGQALLAEGERGCGHGQTMPRSNASQLATSWLHAREQRMVTIQAAVAGRYRLDVRYSNDGLPGEDIALEVNGQTVVGTPFRAFSTRLPGQTPGHGWNVFQWSAGFDVDLRKGLNTVEAKVSGGDGYGFELDVVRATPIGS